MALELAQAADVPVHVVVPPGARRGVVVLHEIFGIQPEILRVCERFASAGWAAVAPDLYARGRLSCLRAGLDMLRTGRGPLADRIAGVRDWLGATHGIPAGSVGVVGFCLGGGYALAVGSRFAAVSANYGEVPEDEALAGCAPTIACFGGRDRMFAPKAKVLQTKLERAGVAHEVHVFAEVGHSFLTDGHHPVASTLSRPFLQVGYDAATAEAAWTKIFAFVDRHVPTAEG